MHKRTLASLHYENMPYDGVRFHILKRGRLAIRRC